MTPPTPFDVTAAPAAGAFDPTVVPPPGLPADPRSSHRPPPTPFADTPVHGPMREWWLNTDTPAADSRPASGAAGGVSDIARRHQAYQLRRAVGRGTFGEVWEAVQVRLNRIVAVKKPRDHAGEDVGPDGQPPAPAPTPFPSDASVAEGMFRREGFIAAGLDHPNIVPVYDMGRDQAGQPLLAMKLVQGRVWDDLIEADGGLAPGESLARHLPTLAAVGRAVEFAHSRGVVHRDLKPAQVMVGGYGDVYLMDWGLAISIGGGVVSGTDATDMPWASGAAAAAGAEGGNEAEGRRPAGAVPGGWGAIPAQVASNPAGTVAFMAPEQTESTAARLGPWTDVYLLGGILYLLLTGTRPHDQDSAYAAFHHAARGVIDDPATRAPGREMPPELTALAMAAMARDPADKVPSAGAFVEALESYRSGATRRARSAELAVMAAPLIEPAGSADPPAPPAHSRHDTLEAGDRIVQEALAEWPDNPRALELRRVAAIAFAEGALAEGDLTLAEAQAGRIDSAGPREALMNRIGAARRMCVRLARRRRLALAGSFALLATVGALGVALARNAGETATAEAHAARQSAENKAARDLADQRRAIEHRRAEISTRRAALLADTAQAVEAAVREVPLPVEINPEEDWAMTRLTLQREAAARLDKALAAIDEARRAGANDGIPLPPEPPELLQAKGVLALHGARGTSGTMTAFRWFEAAAAANPDDHRHRTGMAIAAARAGEYDRAVIHALEAVARVAQDSQDYAPVSELVNRIHTARWRDATLPAGDVGLTAGSDTPDYAETGTGWSVIGGGKVGAYGVVSTGARENRGMTFYSPFGDVRVAGPVTAEFRPAAAPAAAGGVRAVVGRRHVYAAWSAYANARPVYYRVRHAAGETTLALVQDGYGVTGAANAHLWTPLGNFVFSGAADEGVTVAAGDDVSPLNEMRRGLLEGGAVAFTVSPLDRGVTGSMTAAEAGPFPEAVDALPAGAASAPPPDVDWSPDLASAKELSAATGRPLLVLTSWPVSSAFIHPLNRGRDYCERRLMRHPLVQRAASDWRYVAVRVDGTADPDAVRAYGAETGVTLCLCRPDGSVARRLAGRGLLASPAALAEMMGDAAAGGD